MTTRKLPSLPEEMRFRQIDFTTPPTNNPVMDMRQRNEASQIVERANDLLEYRWNEMVKEWEEVVARPGREGIRIWWIRSLWEKIYRRKVPTYTAFISFLRRIEEVTSEIGEK